RETAEPWPTLRQPAHVSCEHEPVLMSRRPPPLARHCSTYRRCSCASARHSPHRSRAVRAPREGKSGALRAIRLDCAPLLSLPPLPLFPGFAPVVVASQAIGPYL